MDRFEGKPEQKVTNLFEEGTQINVTVGKPIRPGAKQEPPADPETPIREFPNIPTSDDV
jgi:hypothetical protein